MFDLREVELNEQRPESVHILKVRVISGLIDLFKQQMQYRQEQSVFLLLQVRDNPLIRIDNLLIAFQCKHILLYIFLQTRQRLQIASQSQLAPLELRHQYLRQRFHLQLLQLLLLLKLQLLLFQHLQRLAATRPAPALHQLQLVHLQAVIARVIGVLVVVGLMLLLLLLLQLLLFAVAIVVGVAVALLLLQRNADVDAGAVALQDLRPAAAGPALMWVVGASLGAASVCISLLLLLLDSGSGNTQTLRAE